ncbi:MAG: phosphoribosyl-ATP diphosphatase [Proteobacteria bacterium]|nr:phosphoribosyl-ATP diphosphatase [Pseudomonadota bacterium]
MILNDVFEVIEKRFEEGDPEKSYTAKLKKEGIEKILKKIQEETMELILAGWEGEKKKIIAEASDLLFHTMILLKYRDVKFSDIEDEFRKRFGISGIEEKKLRKIKKGAEK